MEHISARSETKRHRSTICSPGIMRPDGQVSVLLLPLSEQSFEAQVEAFLTKQHIQVSDRAIFQSGEGLPMATVVGTKTVPKSGKVASAAFCFTFTTTKRLICAWCL